MTKAEWFREKHPDPEEDNDENEWEIQMPGIQTFYDLNDYKIPLEYEVILPDINSEIYEIFNEETYEKFISKSKSIFEKYKNECNPKNKKLVKVDEKCDEYFDNNYTHGGYECGEDGNWTNKCVPSYCDMGYIFDHNKKECVIDYCDENKRKENKREENNINEENNKLSFIIILIIIISSIIILIILGIIIYKCAKTMRNRSQSNLESIAKFSLVLQDY